MHADDLQMKRLMHDRVKATRVANVLCLYVDARSSHRTPDAVDAPVSCSSKRPGGHSNTCSRHVVA